MEEFEDDLFVRFGQYDHQICFLILSQHFNIGLNLFRNDAFKFVFQKILDPFHVDEAKRRFLDLSYELIKFGGKILLLFLNQVVALKADLKIMSVSSSLCSKCRAKV